VEPKIRRPSHLVKLKTYTIPLDPSDFRFFDREGSCLIREDEPNAERGSPRYGAGTFNRAAKHREVHDLSLCDCYRIGKHHGVLHSEGDSIVMPQVGSCRFHGDSV